MTDVINEFQCPYKDSKYRSKWEEYLKDVFNTNSSWISDGLCYSSLPIRFQNSDLIVFVNLNPFYCCFNIFRRAGLNLLGKAETVDVSNQKTFTKRICYFINFKVYYRIFKFVVHKKEIRYLLKGSKFIELTNRREIDLFLEKVSI